MDGFLGNSAAEFIRETNLAMNEAIEEHNKDPFEGESFNEYPPPPLGSVHNERVPFSDESTAEGRYSVGVGTSDNVVVDNDEYEDITRVVDQIDEQAGSDLFRAAEAIETMCSSIYIVPVTVPRVLAITNQLKNSLREFRSLTEEANIHTRRFANEIREIDEERL